MKNILLILPFILLSACISLPKTVPQAMMEANIKHVPYAKVNQDIHSYKDSPVHWGGVIIDIHHMEKHSLAQVLYYPLDHLGRPQLGKTHEGRFIIKSTEFFDPFVYTKNAEISVIGKLSGDIERTFGKRSIQVPVLLAENIYVWPRNTLNDDEVSFDDEKYYYMFYED